MIGFLAEPGGLSPAAAAKRPSVWRGKPCSSFARTAHQRPAARFLSAAAVLARLRLLIDFRRTDKARLTNVREVDALFRRYLGANRAGRCLLLAFEVEECDVLGENWVRLDLERMQRRAARQGVFRVDLEDGYFDAVMCANLGSISKPTVLLSEIRRLLSGGGQLWVETPLTRPLPRGSEEHPEYWRITPDGLRGLLRDFDEIFCDAYAPGDNLLNINTFFYGLKPMQLSAGDSP